MSPWPFVMLAGFLGLLGALWLAWMDGEGVNDEAKPVPEECYCKHPLHRGESCKVLIRGGYRCDCSPPKDYYEAKPVPPTPEDR